MAYYPPPQTIISEADVYSGHPHINYAAPVQGALVPVVRRPVVYNQGVDALTLAGARGTYRRHHAHHGPGNYYAQDLSHYGGGAYAGGVHEYERVVERQHYGHPGGYPGGYPYQGAGTSDWTIVDVPPGTRRVTLDMANEQDISWNRYNGIRRSRFVHPGESFEMFGQTYNGGPNGYGEQWTEITKDMVTREAIEEMGYQFEETAFFFYVFDYLNRLQIQELVDLTRRIRHRRIREIEYEQGLEFGYGGHHHHGHYDYPEPYEEVYFEEEVEHYPLRRRRSRYY